MLVGHYYLRFRYAALLAASSVLLILGGCSWPPNDDTWGAATITPPNQVAGSRLPENVVEADVVEVVDGDTIRVRLDGNVELVRLIGINAPESDGPYRERECFGREATEILGDLIPSGSTVFLEQDVTNRDRFDRLLRYVWLAASDGEPVLLNEFLVAEGAARQRAYPPDTLHQATLERAEDEAKRGQLGLWAECPATGSY